MYYKLITDDVTSYTGDQDYLIDYVGSMSVDQDQVIQDLADASTQRVERFLSAPLGNRNCTIVFSRNKKEIGDSFSQTLTGSFSIGGPGGISTNQWIDIPSPVTTVTEVSVGQWSGPDIILTEDVDYSVDLDCSYPRIMFSWNFLIYDGYTQYKNLKIKFQGGICEVDGTIPKAINAAIVRMTKMLYDNRGETPASIFDNGTFSLLADYRVPAIGG